MNLNELVSKWNLLGHFIRPGFLNDIRNLIEDERANAVAEYKKLLEDKKAEIESGSWDLSGCTNFGDTKSDETWVPTAKLRWAKDDKLGTMHLQQKWEKKFIDFEDGIEWRKVSIEHI